MVGAPCCPLKYIMSAAKDSSGIQPLVCLWVLTRAAANGGLKLNTGDFWSQMKFSSTTLAALSELIKSSACAPGDRSPIAAPAARMHMSAAVTRRTLMVSSHCVRLLAAATIASVASVIIVAPDSMVRSVARLHNGMRIATEGADIAPDWSTDCQRPLGSHGEVIDVSLENDLSPAWSRGAWAPRCWCFC